MSGVQVFDRLALRLREMVRQEHANSGTGAERFKVLSVAPIRLVQEAGDLVLEDGDPDFTIGAWVRQFLLTYPLHVGDECWCLREGTEWHLVDLTDPGGQVAW